MIIDGLDHVENYNIEDLEKFVQFINKLSLECKTIILSRPLKYKTSWNKQVLTNWNQKETRKVLKELYHIDNYSIGSDIYNLTSGYPILVRFISEHYKTFKNIPSLEKLKGVEDYYNQILKNVNTRTALTLFLTNRSFFMKSELSLFLSGEFLTLINEFIEAYPYLFEIRLNRLSLFHDSFNKYLKELNIDFSERKGKVHNFVYQSIIDGDKKFMSRFSYFDLESWMKVDIIKKYSSIVLFQEIVKDCIDFEAIRAFYIQIRETLNDISHLDLEIINYYDLSLISNIVTRDHISSLNSFLYTYSKSLLHNGYSIEDITSSEYLFGMFTYVLENDSNILYNVTSDSLYDTRRFLDHLENDIDEEESFFEKYRKPIILSKPIEYYFEHRDWREYITEILIDLYIHKTTNKSLMELQNCIDVFIDQNENQGINLLHIILNRYGKDSYYPNWILNEVKSILLSLGKLSEKNSYLSLSLKDYILSNSHNGSFDLWPGILSYLRLALENNKKVDIYNIGLFWCMYYYRKDYTVINMENALKVFEKHKLIIEEKSIKQVVFTQNMSEKGIRHLLADYISCHSPEIINKVLDTFSIDELNISWFNLPSKHINNFPDRLFDYATSKLLTYHDHSRQLEFDEIRNVYYSSKWDKLLDDLKFLKYRIRIPENSNEQEKLENLGLTILPYKKDSFKANTSEYRFKNGMLDSTDIKFIKDNNLSVTQISGYLNGNYSALAEIEIFKIYPKEEVSKNLREIFYNSILGKVHSINMFGSLYHFVGNLPQLISEYGAEVDIAKLFNSFNVFLKLSLLNKIEMTS